MRKWLYLSLTLPADEKAKLVHRHLTIGLKDVVLQRAKSIFYLSSVTGVYLTWEDIKQLMQPHKQK